MGAEYTTVPLVKKQLGIDDGDSDALIQIAVSAACRAIDLYTGTTFYPVTEARLFHGRPDGGIWVDPFVDTTGLVVETGTPGAFTTTIADTDYSLWPPNAPSKGLPYRRIFTSYGQPWAPPHRRGQPNFQITATWGYPEVPPPIAEAALLKAAQLFRRKDSPEAVIGAMDETTARLYTEDDPNFTWLLRNYREIGIL